MKCQAAVTMLGALAALAGVGLPTAARAAGSYGFAKVADTATAIPGGTGTFSSFQDPALNHGYVAFLGNGAGGQQGIYLEAPGGALQAVANTTTAAPGGGTFTGFERPSVDASGDVAFVATTTTGQGVYDLVGGQLHAVATTGTATPGFAGQFAGFTNYGSASIANGAVAFAAFSSGAGGVDQGIYLAQNGGLGLIADRQTALPYGNGTQQMIFIDRPTLDAQGDVIFSATTGSNGQAGIYARENGALARVIDNTQALPGSTSTFEAEGSVDRGPVIAGGRTAFYSNNGFAAASGYYGTNVGGQVVPLITFGTTVPGSNAHFTGIGDLSLDPSGASAVYGSSSAATALYEATSFGGAYSPIIGYLDPLDGKTVQSPSSSIYALSGNQFAFRTTFTDSSSGIYLATQAVPEPASVALLATGMAGLLIGGLRRRRAARGRAA